MSNDKDTIIEELRAELEKARKREQEYAENRKAMLYMLEDLNESAQLIEKAKNAWEATFDAITDPLFMHDRDLNIIRANMAYMEYSGKSFNDILGRPYYSIFPLMERPFESCLNALKKEEEEITISSINKTFKVRSYPVKDTAGRLVDSVHLLEDITAARDFEARLEEEVSTTSDLLSIAEATSSIKDIDKLMSSIVKSAARILKTDICLGYVRSHEKEEFIPYHSEGLPASRLSLFRTRPLPDTEWFLSDAINNKEILITHAPFVDSGEIIVQRINVPAFFFSWLPGMGSMLVIPLSGRAWVNGVLILFYKDTKDFTEKDKKVIKGIMHQVSTALEEARLYRDSVDKALELSHKIETVRVMREIDRSVLSTLNPDEILETVVSLLGRLIPCDRATVAVTDRERGGFIYKAGFGIDIPKGTFVEFPMTSAAGLL
ncbi:MAG: GAF domain-containing protein, partial [Nitrospirota bacterium]